MITMSCETLPDDRGWFVVVRRVRGLQTTDIYQRAYFKGGSQFIEWPVQAMHAALVDCHAFGPLIDTPEPSEPT